MRLIDADKLIDDIKKRGINKLSKGGDEVELTNFVKGLGEAIKIADTACVIDPVKHGHWIERYPTETTDYFSCSVCNAGIFVDNSWRVSNKDVSEIYRYCRGCGAKMEGDCFV